MVEESTPLCGRLPPRDKAVPPAVAESLGTAGEISGRAPLLREFLATLPAPLFVLRGDGFVEFENSAARRAYARRNLLRIRSGRILAIGGDYRSWSAAVRQAAQGAGCAMPFAHIEEGSVLTGIVRLAPVGFQSILLGVWPTATAVAILEFREESENEAALTLFAARYSLTTMELKVLRLIAEGHTPREVAARTNTQVSTVRSHLRSLFNKTGLRRQVDLLRVTSR